MDVSQPTANGHSPSTLPSVATKPGGQPGNKGNTLPKTGNRNAWKHGCRASRLTLANMPAELRNIQRVVNDFRGALEAGCVEAHGGISLAQAATINTAVWNERLSRLWARRLADGYAKMDDEAVGRCTDRIEKHAKARDAAIKALGIDRTPDDDPFATLYAIPAVVAPDAQYGPSKGPGDSEAVSAVPAGSNASVGDDAAVSPADETDEVWADDLP